MESLKRVGAFLKVDNKQLYISEPNPTMFGNPRNESSQNWLTSRFHFSFAEYRSRKENGFGVLRVLNDDLVQPSHPHSNMEIVTFVAAGSLTHKDSMGTKESLPPGSVQFMSAGSGIVHSEFNDSPTEPLRFIQVWITPCKHGIKPNYGSYVPAANEYNGAWFHLVSDVESKVSTPVKINQDANFFVLDLNLNESASFTIEAERQGYLVCLEGNTEFSTNDSGEKQILAQLENHDAAEIKGPIRFEVVAHSRARLLLVEMKKTNESRF